MEGIVIDIMEAKVIRGTCSFVRNVSGAHEVTGRHFNNETIQTKS